MRFIIIDGGLVHQFGHNYKYAVELKRVLLERNVAVDIFASVLADKIVIDRLDAKRALFSNIYSAFSVHADYQFLTYWLETNKSIEQDLHTIASVGFEKTDNILIHSTWSSQALGIYRWYIRLPAPKPNICLQFHGSHIGLARLADHDVSSVLFRKSLECWASFRSGVTLCGTNEALSKHMSDVSGLKIHTAPIITTPIDVSGGPIGPTGPTLGLIGAPRGEKGHDLIKEIKDNQAGSAPFRLVTQEENLSAEKYQALVAQCDGFILPYKPDSYHLRASAIFVEALGAGCPVVVSPGGWAAGELAQWGSPGVVAEGYEAAAFARAIGKLVAQFDLFQQRARSVAPLVRKHFSAENYLDTLARAGFGPAAAGAR